MNEEKTGYGYGKRPLWQWVVLYAVVGGVLYGLVYYFFFANKGGYNYSTPAYAPVSNQTTPAPSPEPIAPVSPQSVQSVSVAISDFAFSPKQLSVKVGTKVTWTNKDGAAHTVTSNDGFFESGTLNTGGTYSYVFPVPGTYSYHCRPHPYMTATVVVTQ